MNPADWKKTPASIAKDKAYDAKVKANIPPKRINTGSVKKEEMGGYVTPKKLIQKKIK